MFAKNQFAHLSEDERKIDLKLSGETFLKFISNINADTKYQFPSLIYPSLSKDEALKRFYPVTGFTHMQFETLQANIIRTGENGDWKLAVLYAILLAQVAATVGLNEVVRARLHAAAGGAKGGNKKAAKQMVPRRKALQFVADEWRKWQKNHRPGFGNFWEFRAGGIQERLKAIDPAAAATLTRGKQFITAKAMQDRIRKTLTIPGGTANTFKTANLKK